MKRRLKLLATALLLFEDSSETKELDELRSHLESQLWYSLQAGELDGIVDELASYGLVQRGTGKLGATLRPTEKGIDCLRAAKSFGGVRNVLSTLERQSSV